MNFAKKECEKGSHRFWVVYNLNFNEIAFVSLKKVELIIFN